MEQPTLLVVLIAAVIGHGSAAVSPLRQADTPAGRCREYSADETRLSRTGTLQVKCTYETATNQHVCHEQSSGAGYSFVQTTQFGSVADFIGDPSKVSFFSRATTITIKFPTSTSTQNYSYDARGYLAKITTLSNAGAGGSTVQTFTAWDAFGRPTAGRDETQNYALTYDDAGRVVTLKAGALPSVITVKLDANGNQAETTTVTPTFRDTTKITIRSTEKICK